LQWLADHQLPDGSWGSTVQYEHDRIVCTLAALATLATFGRRDVDRARVAAGTRYLWQHGHLLAAEPAALVDFELLLPALIERARRVGVVVPPYLDVYASKRADQLRQIPDDALYTPCTALAHSLEFLGEHADPERLREAQGSNGAIGNSPAATAFFAARTGDSRALAYLQRSLIQPDAEAVPVLSPCETFELLWTAYHLFLVGVPASRLLGASEHAALLQAVENGGVARSASFPVPDADDTAIALLLLHDVGEKKVDPDVLQRFALPGGRFARGLHESKASVGASLHVLHALLRIPGYPAQDRVVAQLLDYLTDQQVNGAYWLDPWHISPYYATAHVLRVFAELPEQLAARVARQVEGTRTWLRQTQNGDGSWGFYGRRTLEETAYAALALAAAPLEQVSAEDRERCAGAVRCLEVVREPGRASADLSLPPLWIDKCLYAPTLVVRGVVEAALRACDRLLRPGRAPRGARR
jgi:halimadienyl-diphosphate synthase